MPVRMRKYVAEQWEYKVVIVWLYKGNNDEVELLYREPEQGYDEGINLNELGAKGWELVALRPFRDGGHLAFLKRRIIERMEWERECCERTDDEPA